MSPPSLKKKKCKKHEQLQVSSSHSRIASHNTLQTVFNPNKEKAPPLHKCSTHSTVVFSFVDLATAFDSESFCFYLLIFKKILANKVETLIYLMK